MKATTPESAQNYRLDTLSNKVLQESLLAMMEMLIRDKDDAWQFQTKTRLSEIFEQWKTEHDRNDPKTRRGVRGLDAFRSVAFEDAAPYECAGPETGVTDYVTLFLHLAKCKYPPVVAILESEDMQNLVAVSALLEPETVQLASLLWQVTLTLDSLTRSESRWRGILTEAGPILRARAASKRGLAKAQPMGAKKKKATATELHHSWKVAATEYLMKFPNKTLDDAATYIETAPSLNPPNANGKRRAFATIRDAIAGCGEDARAQLSKVQKVRQV